MRILYFTAGSASMYCGSCLRDNALAAELLRQGHDVILTPFYTPTLTDEPNVSRPQVFFGGISVYLQQRLALFRKTPWALDRLWDSRFVLERAARRRIPTSPRLLGEFTVAVLEGERGPVRKEVEKLLHWLRSEPAPHVVSLPFALLIALAGPIKAATGRPVCCTLQGEDLFLESLEPAHRARALELIRENIRHVDAFLPVSDYYREFMSDYLGIPPGKMHAAPLGISLSGYQPRAARTGGVFRIGYFARIAPEKGLKLLGEACVKLRRSGQLPAARLEAAGYLAPEHKPYLKSVHRLFEEAGLAGEFRYYGSPGRDGKIRFLESLDVFSVPSPYREPKGLPVLEAMASGVPVIAPRHGAFPEMLAKTHGGLLFEPHSVDSLADALLELYEDTDLRIELGRRGGLGVRAHYRIEDAARGVVGVFENICAETAGVERCSR
ncbi:MAG: glycosyltransferase family 4 protein [Acidobacteria bacterium]|nr:glycosyltransferase family 4 protein [Acidobacteriota bacterium]